MNPVRRVTVNTPSRHYPVLIGAGVLGDRPLWREFGTASRIAIVSNSTVAPLYLNTVRAALPSLSTPPLEIILSDGEAHKTWASVAAIFDALLAAQCDRDTLLVALGGGVIGDLTGFAAATYQRGIDFIQVPTTLLAQVDSSVGGKTGINHPRGKNMIGAFHQPRAVFADVDTLASLPKRELRAGLAEVIKHGLMADAELFGQLERSMPALLAGKTKELSEVVDASVRIKSAIVEADERESGLRALLNFGHTFGHAIEAGLGFGVWLHGEAVAAGMVLAAQLSAHLDCIAESDVQRVRGLIEAAELPTRAPEFSADEWLRLMANDKKARASQLRFVILDAIGSARVIALDPSAVRQFFLSIQGVTTP